MNLHRIPTVLIAGCCAVAVTSLSILPLPAQEGSGAAGVTQDGEELLTSGPIHEAFAQAIPYSAEPGITVSVRPPDPIEEVPPDTKPEGDNVDWIPGYWGWDDTRNDFIWISGVWRNLPPGREWVPGYWAETGSDTWQWISGYWADAGDEVTEYLPEPPKSLEAGPNVDPPGGNYIWQPGSWVWIEGRYQWRPGYWVEGREDWVWTPPTYYRTPRGFVYVNGYWDYPEEYRGVVFYPVYYPSRSWCYRPGYAYTPSVVITISSIRSSLFLHTRSRHYYCGDYYAASWRDAGYHPWHSYHTSRRGYDPIYVYNRFRHRNDRDWDRRLRNEYDYFVRTESARPPRTWKAYRERMGRNDRDRREFAADLREFAGRADHAKRFGRISGKDRTALTERARRLRAVHDERRTIEKARGEARDRNIREQVRRPRSPIRLARADVPESRRPPAARPDRESGRPGRTAGPPDRAPSVRPGPDRPGPRGGAPDADGPGRRGEPAKPSANPPGKPSVKPARPAQQPRPGADRGGDRRGSQPGAQPGPSRPGPAPKAGEKPDRNPGRDPKAAPSRGGGAAPGRKANDRKPSATPGRQSDRRPPAASRPDRPSPPSVSPRTTPPAKPSAAPKRGSSGNGREKSAVPSRKPDAPTPSAGNSRRPDSGAKARPAPAPRNAPKSSAPPRSPQPKASPKPSSKPAPKAAAKATPRAAPKAAPRAARKAAPKASPRPAPNAAPKASPRPAPKPAPKAAPRPGPAPKAGGSGGSSGGRKSDRSEDDRKRKRP